MERYRAQFEEHAGHRLAVMLDAEDMSAGVMCETCGEYVIEWDDYEPPPTVEQNAVLSRALREIASRDTLATQTIAGCRRKAREALASLNRAQGAR